MSTTEAPGQTGSSNTHARLSPSSSNQWRYCTASLANIEANGHRIPEDTSSEFSNEGTEAHEWAAKVLLKQITIEEVPESFREYIDACVKHCLATVPEGVSYQVEVECPLFYQPSNNGTCDFAVVTDESVVIRDYKHGAGVLVSAHENSQLAIYAMSLIRLMEDVYDFTDATTVEIGIFQPRHREAHNAEPWVLTLKELTDFCEVIEKQAMLAFGGVTAVQEKLPCGKRDISEAEILAAAPQVVFMPQDGDDGSCRWCDCKAWCSARLAAATEGMDAGGRSGAELIALLPDLSKEDAKRPADERITVAACEVVPEGETGIIVSDDYLVNVYRNAKAIRRFLNDVEEHLTARALAGNPATGTKLVEGRQSNRAWANEDAADTFLRGKGLKLEERYKFKLKSPTEMEKVLDIPKQPKRTQTRWAELVTRSPGKPVLALADDKREAIGAPVDLLPDLGADDEV